MNSNRKLIKIFQVLLPKHQTRPAGPPRACQTVPVYWAVTEAGGWTVHSRVEQISLTLPESRDTGGQAAGGSAVQTE